jgi:hypothetical protein
MGPGMIIRRVMFSGFVAAQALLVGIWLLMPSPQGLTMCLLAVGGEASSIVGFSALRAERRQPRAAGSFMRDCTVLALVAWAVGLVVAVARLLARA